MRNRKRELDIPIAQGPGVAQRVSVPANSCSLIKTSLAPLYSAVQRAHAKSRQYSFTQEAETRFQLL